VAHTSAKQVNQPVWNERMAMHTFHAKIGTGDNSFKKIRRAIRANGWLVFVRQFWLHEGILSIKV